MKKRLIALFTLSRSIDQTKDRGGKYSLRKVNQFAKLGPMAKPAAAKAVAPAVQEKEPKLDAQPSLFEPDNSKKAVTPKVNETDGTPEIKTAIAPVQPKPAPKAKRFPWGKLKAIPMASLRFLAKPAVMLWRKLRGPAPDVRPRAQAELALEKVTVLRNDLSDADVMVVAKEREELKPADPQAGTGTNSWTKATARWIKLKETAGGETRGEMPAARSPELAQTP